MAPDSGVKATDPESRAPMARVLLPLLQPLLLLLLPHHLPLLVSREKEAAEERLLPTVYHPQPHQQQ